MIALPPPHPLARPARRRFLRGGATFAAFLAAPCLPARAQALADTWCATWGTAPAGPPPAASLQDYSGCTLRLIVRTSIGGERVRIRISNEMGDTPLRIGRAAVGLRSVGAAVEPASLRELCFGGQHTITVPAGAPVLSDAVDLPLAAQADLSVSLYFPGNAPGATVHNTALQTGYVSPAGDYAGMPALPVARTIASWPFLTEVDVDAAAPAVVVLGDSLSDGVGSTGNLNRRWPDYLARRLHGAGVQAGVVNRGISANLLLSDYPSAQLAGRDTLERFDRDVLATAGARWLLPLIGINDICYSPGSNPIPVTELVTGYRQLTARARARGLGVIGATLPPFAGFVYCTSAREAARRAVNDWMRTCGEFDALADVELALRDPLEPARILAAYDSGDHLHPNDAGHAAIADCVPLAAFGGAQAMRMPG